MQRSGSKTQGLFGPLSTHHNCTDFTPISTAVFNLCFSWSSVAVDPMDQSAKPIFSFAISFAYHYLVIFFL
jgi:hypothetical protein